MRPVNVCIRLHRLQFIKHVTRSDLLRRLVAASEKIQMARHQRDLKFSFTESRGIPRMVPGFL